MTSIPSPRSGRRARIEIIPLIDIIFFLLATFVMVSLSMVKNRGISVNLPAASTGAPQAQEESAVISITAGGDIYFNKERVEIGQLEATLGAFHAAHEEGRIIIRGDAHAEFGRAVEVLDHARRLGLTKVAIETQPKATP